jgi:hypothetical protein
VLDQTIPRNRARGDPQIMRTENTRKEILSVPPS